MSGRGCAFPKKAAAKPAGQQTRGERATGLDRAITMPAGEWPKRRSDEVSELRDGSNQLCTALTLSAGANSAAAERVLQELQALAQMISARQGETDCAPPKVAAADTRPAADMQRRPGNVVAFRFKVKGSSAEDPRLPAALNVLTGARGPASGAGEAVDWNSSLGRIGGSLSTRPPVAPAPDAALQAAVAGQGAEIEQLARSSDSQRQLLERLEQRLRGGGTAPEMAGDVAALRS